jgi:hypothetical protein
MKSCCIGTDNERGIVIVPLRWPPITIVMENEQLIQALLRILQQ